MPVSSQQQQEYQHSDDVYYASLKEEIFGEAFAAATGAPIITMRLGTAYNELTKFPVYDLIVDLFQKDGVPIHILGMNGDLEKTVLQLEWEGATEARPFSEDMNETLTQKIGPHSGTLFRYGVQSIATDEYVWNLR